MNKKDTNLKALLDDEEALIVLRSIYEQVGDRMSKKSMNAIMLELGEYNNDNLVRLSDLEIPELSAMVRNELTKRSILREIEEESDVS